jgi:hypothetical protein
VIEVICISIMGEIRCVIGLIWLECRGRRGQKNESESVALSCRIWEKKKWAKIFKTESNISTGATHQYICN